MKILLPLLMAAIMFTLVAPDARGANERRLLRTTVTGKAGEKFTVYQAAVPISNFVTFNNEVGDLKATVVWSKAANGVPLVQEMSNRAGDVTLPLLAGPVRILTIEFVTDGSCDIEVYDAAKR